MLNRLGLDRFFKEEPRNTLFEKTNAFNSIHGLIKELRSKRIELEEAATKKGDGSPDFLKHNVVKRLLDNMDNEIDSFNRAGAAANELDEKKRVLALTRAIKQQVDTTLQMEDRILRTPRDNRRKYLNDGIEIGAVGTAVGVAVLGPMYFTSGVIAVAGAKAGNVLARDLSGISNLDPMTLRTLRTLAKELEKIDDNLSVYLRDNSKPAPGSS